MWTGSCVPPAVSPGTWVLLLSLSQVYGTTLQVCCVTFMFVQSSLCFDSLGWSSGPPPPRFWKEYFWVFGRH